MKRFVSATTLLIALTGISLRAQTIDLRANIPFEFRMGDVVLPAGEYQIHHSGGVLRVRNESGNRSGVMALTQATSRPGTRDFGGLQFNRYDETYFLSKVWTPNSQDGRLLPKTSREKELVGRAALVETARVSFRNK